MNTLTKNHFFEDLEKGLQRNEYDVMEIDNVETVDTFSIMEATFYNVVLLMRNRLNYNYETYISSFFSSKKIK